jgi:hypothetical protein
MTEPSVVETRVLPLDCHVPRDHQKWKHPRCMGPWPLWWVCDDRMDRAVARTQGGFDLADRTQEACQRSGEFASELFGQIGPREVGEGAEA